MATGKGRDREREVGGKYDMCNEVLIGAQIMPMSVPDSVAHAKCQSETFIAHTFCGCGGGVCIIKIMFVTHTTRCLASCSCRPR